MELRAGRYAFNLGLKEFGPLLGMADLALKLMPMTMKMKIALNANVKKLTVAVPPSAFTASEVTMSSIIFARETKPPVRLAHERELEDRVD